MVIYRHKEKYSISEICGFLSVSRSGYYDYVKRMDIEAKDLPLQKRLKNAKKNAIKLMDIAEYIIWLERNGIHRNPKTVLRVI